MQHTTERPRDAIGRGRTGPRARRRRRSGAVMLATFDSAPFDPEAARFAVDTAVESGRALIVVNALDFVPGGRLTRIDPPIDPPAVADALRAPAELAHALGVRVERLRVLSPRPVAALLELVAERRPVVVAFGPDPAALRRLHRPTRRRARRFLRALERDAACLLWSAQELAAGAVSSSASPSSRANPAPMRRASPGSATTIARPTSSRIATANGSGRRGTPGGRPGHDPG
jgi:nucleotide-binding universal stress UspA family protein